MLGRKKRTTKKKSTPKKKPIVGPFGVPMLDEKTVAAIPIPRDQMAACQRLKYELHIRGEGLVNLLKDPRPVYIVMPNGDWRFWNWVNQKKGINRDPILMLNK